MIAQQLTLLDFDTSGQNLVVLAGAPLKVVSMAFNSTVFAQNTTWEVFNADSTKTLWTMNMFSQGQAGRNAAGRVGVTIPFIADEGLSVTATLSSGSMTDIMCLVQHMSPGI